MRVLVPLVVLTLLAGCVATPGDAPADGSAGMGASTIVLGGTTIHAAAVDAGLSFVHVADGAEATVHLPEGTLVQDEKGVLRPAKGSVKVEVGKSVTFLPPWNSTGLAFEVESGGVKQALNVTSAQDQRLVSGDLAVALLKVQRDQFPHRTPGMPNYAKAQAYFADFFKALNYTVETNSYGNDLTLPVPNNPGPQSLESVLGIKKGTTKADRYIVFGGHFDVVEETTEGAFDNTAGTVATLAMAQAFANVTTEHTLIFAAWGGEEDGILGSQAWISANPDKIPFIDAYVNFDVVSLAFPAPKPEPAPIVVTAGPDGPIADTLHAYAAAIEKTYVRSGAELVMEDWAANQATGTLGLGGAGVNAQSDHTPFAQRGIPSYFLFTGKVNDVFALIHSEKDTTENLTKYSLRGVEGIGQEFTPEEMAEGEWLLARSFEAQMAPMFYFATLLDTGVLAAPVDGPMASVEGLTGL